MKIDAKFTITLIKPDMADIIPKNIEFIITRGGMYLRKSLLRILGSLLNPGIDIRDSITCLEIESGPMKFASTQYMSKRTQRKMKMIM